MATCQPTVQYENLTDCLNRLWDKKDYDVNNTLDRLNCTYCKEVGHTVRSCLQLSRETGNVILGAQYFFLKLSFIWSSSTSAGGLDYS